MSPLLRALAAAGKWVAARISDTLARALSWRAVLAIILGSAALAWAASSRSFPAPGVNPILDLIATQDPAAYHAIRGWFLVAPGAAVFGSVLLFTGAWRVWVESRRSSGRWGRGTLPPWPADPSDEAPSLVVGELHHPVVPAEVVAPQWLTIPEKGLYTGIVIFGAIGTGKTSGCMNPFARQLLTWQADNEAKRAAALVLEVKGDFCYDIKDILTTAGRERDYLELGLGGRWQWNPLDSDLDSYSLAFTIATLLSQLFGRSKEPFWQQAYTNLVRWIIELHRALPDPWCTLRDVYHCAIDPELFKRTIDKAKRNAGLSGPETLYLDAALWQQHYAASGLDAWTWKPAGPGRFAAPADGELVDRLTELGLRFETAAPPPSAGDLAARVAAVERWYKHDWMALDAKLRTSIVEGVSTFLAMFDLPDNARVFCPPKPTKASPSPVPNLPPPPDGEAPPSAGGAMLRPLPRLDRLIEDGRVLALNMPAGASPALARAMGVMLKNAWLQALLKRPAQMKRHPDKYFRPAVFICDEYQSFATVGEDDPSGDEKSFALTRQCRCIPIVATQSISSLRSVLPGQDAWRALIQTLRTRIFLSLSDESSAELASSMCGKVLRYTPTYSFSEQSQPGLSISRARAGGGKGSIGASKSFRETRDPLFHPRSFTLLDNCQAIVLPYDGRRSLSATRVYLKPYYLDRDLPYWRARQEKHL